MKNFNRMDVLDVVSTIAYMAMLYAANAPWWTYCGAIAFGTMQRIIGLQRAGSES